MTHFNILKDFIIVSNLILKEKKMTNTEFKNIFDNGYKVNYTKGTSEVRCPKCGNESYLSSNYSTTITCKNKHNFALIDFTIEWTKIRDDMLKTFLDHQQEQSCNI